MQNQERTDRTAPGVEGPTEEPTTRSSGNKFGIPAADPREETTSQSVLDEGKAQARHLRRFKTQLAAWGTILVLAAGSYPIQYALTEDYVTKCLKVSDAQQLACVFRPYGIFALAFISLLASLLAYHMLRRARARDRWEIALHKARSMVEPRITATGYTGLFNIYVRTKRRSYILMAWGLLAFTYVIMGLIVHVKMGLGVEVLSAPILLISLIAKSVLGLLLLQRAYVIGSSFTPGEVLVEHTLTLATMAAFDVTPEEAARRVREAMREFVTANPWWFYSGADGSKIVSFSLALPMVLVTGWLVVWWFSLH